jgi:putative hydroxymethylpyrimidine transporter CytX
MTSQPTLGFTAHFLLWFGAAVSVAEMLAGGFLAELGFARGMTANLLGHLAGTVILVLAGLAAFRQREPAVRSMRASLGARGSWLVSGLNVLQLVGWTAVMVFEGGHALSGLGASLGFALSQNAAALILGGGIALWAAAGVTGMRTVNVAAAGLLLVLCTILGVRLFGQPMPVVAPPPPGAFGRGFELACVMPLSWFPLIGDYACRAKNARSAWLAPLLGYFSGSCLMYGLGLAGALTSGSPEPTAIMLAAGFGSLALVVIALSTITTTFLDVFSAAVSTANVAPRTSLRLAAVGFTVLGTLLASVLPVERYIDFLLLVGSLFAPLAGLFLADAYLLKADRRALTLDLPAMASWAAGFVFYRLVMNASLPVGPTLTAVVFTALLHCGLRLALPGARKSPSAA